MSFDTRARKPWVLKQLLILGYILFTLLWVEMSILVEWKPNHIHSQFLSCLRHTIGLVALSVLPWPLFWWPLHSIYLLMVVVVGGVYWYRHYQYSMPNTDLWSSGGKDYGHKMANTVVVYSEKCNRKTSIFKF